MMDHSLENIKKGKSVVTLRRVFDENQMDDIVGAALHDPATKSISVRRVGRNKTCPCGSGEKFKKCCLWKVNSGVEVLTA